MLTGTIVLVKRSEQITELNIDGIIGLSEENPNENSANRQESYEHFRKQIEAIRQISTPEIIVNIRSSGGNVNDALLIHDILCESKKQITTRCYGYVASAATLIAQAASKGRREMSANSLYLIHQSISSGAGNAGTLEQTVDLLNQTDRRIAELYAARSGKSIDHFIQLMAMNQGNGKWLSAREAKTAGLIDRVIPAHRLENQNRQILQQLNLPALPEVSPCETSKTLLKTALSLLQDTLTRLSEKPADPLSNDPAPSSDAPIESPLPPNNTSSDPIPQTIVNQTPVQEIQEPPLRTQARATATESQEDPGQEDLPAPSNARAYQQDAEQFFV